MENQLSFVDKIGFLNGFDNSSSKLSSKITVPLYTMRRRNHIKQLRRNTVWILGTGSKKPQQCFLPVKSALVADQQQLAVDGSES